MFRLQNALKPVPLGEVGELNDDSTLTKDWATIQKQNNYLKTLTFFHEFFTEQEEQDL